MCVTDVVIAAHPFVRTESLVFHGSQSRLVDISAWNVPAWREAGLVENQRSPGICNDAITVTDHEVTGALADVDAVVTVRGMTHDSLVFFVKCVHRRPGKSHPSLQFARMVRQVDMLPGPSWRSLLARSNDIPRSESQFVMLRCVLATL